MPACKAGHGMDRSVEGFLTILLVKSDVTSPYQMIKNIVSRPLLLKDTNLGSRVPRKFSETSSRHMLKVGFECRRFKNTRTAHSYSALLVMGNYCQKEIWSEIILPAYFLKEIYSGVRQERYSVVASIQIYFTQVI